MLDDQSNQLIESKHRVNDLEKEYQRKYQKVEKNLKNQERNIDNIHKEKAEMENYIENLKNQINDREENIISYRLEIDKLIKEEVDNVLSDLGYKYIGRADVLKSKGYDVDTYGNMVYSDVYKKVKDE